MLIEKRIENTIAHLFSDSRYDRIKMIKSIAKNAFKPMQPSTFKDVYLSISKEQGEDLIDIIKKYQLKKIVEFGTSFGISTLFLAQGVIETGGNIITTELIKSKAKKAIENFENAGINHLIEVRIGDAMETLKNHTEPIDLLLLDGWKDLYLPLFRMLEPNFHPNTFIYVDNTDMADTQAFLKIIRQDSKYHLQSQYRGKVVLITIK